MNLRLFSIIILLLSGGLAFSQSVLSSGNWYKIGVTKSGVYKMDRDFLSKELKISVNSLDPRTVKIYGTGGGGMLPQENRTFRYSDPPQNAIYAVGESDGKMDNGDYFLFYGNDPNKVQLRSGGSLDYSKNLYSDTTYYFLTYGNDPGLRMETLPNAASGGTNVTSYQDYIIYEKDEVNILKSGREWYSVPYSTGFQANKLTDIFKHSVSGIKDSIGIKIKLLGATLHPASIDISFNQNLLANVPVAAIADATYVDWAIEYPVSYSVQNNTTSELELKIQFNENRVNRETSQAYLDYYILGFERDLSMHDPVIFFRNRKYKNQQVSYSINTQGKSDLIIWNLSDKIKPKIQLFTSSGSTMGFNATNSVESSEYVAFSQSALPAPKSFGQIPNQNIKSNVNVDGVIITTQTFLSEAQRLAQFHLSHDGFSIQIVTTRQIYNEFSSGMQDVSAIRDYLKFVWDNGNKQLKYALLFGDGSYDYKNRLANNQNFVPVYESYESIHKLYSHSSDDYFGFLEDDEGDWYEGDQHSSGTPISGTYHDHTLDIGVGRLPVKSEQEAEDVVNKIIRYATSKNTLGKWRNEVVYIADDGDRNVHMQDAEDLNVILKQQFPQYYATRLYLDNFDQPDYRSPSMKLAIKEKLADGIFIMDYLGHGGDAALMQESVFDKTLISELNNRHKLPLFVTATCNFGVYDDPELVSGAEEFLLHPNGGAIALLSTTRAVYAHTNYLVNKAFHESVFPKTDGIYPRLGDVMRYTKNNSLSGPINRNFALLGDPMLMLNYPKYDIRFEELEAKRDTLSALEKVTLTGNVYSGDAINTSFDGTATVTVWDIPREKTTKGLDNPATGGLEFEMNDPFSYMEQDNALFRGQATVSKGTFQTTFILPKNASYKYQEGRITAYALNEDDFIDASGANQNFVIGGTGEIKEDRTPPAVSIYINEPTFRNGDVVGPGSLFVANLSDENGINISSNGFNQNLSLTLNDTLEIILNSYYTASMDDFTSGSIVYPFQDLPKGSYKGQLKVWDSYNNYSINQVEFKVSDKPRIRLFNVMNYPNPVSLTGETTFTFEHDRAGEQLKVRIVLYDMMGGKVNEWVNELDDVANKVDDLTYFTTNQNGDQLKKGVYFYKLQVTSSSDKASNEVINRLIINN